MNRKYFLKGGSAKASTERCFPCSDIIKPTKNIIGKGVKNEGEPWWKCINIPTTKVVGKEYMKIHIDTNKSVNYKSNDINRVWHQGTIM